MALVLTPLRQKLVTVTITVAHRRPVFLYSPLAKTVDDAFKNLCTRESVQLHRYHLLPDACRLTMTVEFPETIPRVIRIFKKALSDYVGNQFLWQPGFELEEISER